MVKISNLPAIVASALSTDDIVPLVDLAGNVTDKATLQQLITYFFNNIPAGTIPGSVFDYVISGGVWSGDAYASTRNASMTAISVYINGRTIAIAAVTARTFTASRDTYIDILDNLDGTGTLVYTEVTNNNASPALAANSIRIGIIVTAAGSIAAVGSVNQGQENKILPIASSIAYSVTDSLGNLICPRDPNRNLLGYRQIIADITTTSTSIVQATGLTCPVIVPTGRRVRVTFFATSFGTGGGGGTPVVEIWDGVVGSGTRIGQSNALNANSMFHAADAQTTPTPGSRTYNIGHRTSSGTNTMTAAATFPAFIRVELI